MKKRKQNLQKKQKLLRLKIAIRDFILDELWVYLIVLGTLALCSWLFNRWIEGIMFAVAHVSLRRVFDKQFHFSSTAHCLILTCAIIWLAIPITLPITASLLSSIPIAFAVCFFGYLAQDRVDLLKATKGKERFDFKNCTKEQVIEVCNALGYNKFKQDLAVMFFVDKLSNKEVWELLCNTQRNVEWDTVKKYKYRITKDFKSVIKEEE